MTNISVRGLDEETTHRLRNEAARQGISMNSLALRLLRRGVGLREEGPRQPIHHDLDHLAGTWDEEEAVAFEESQRDFERIDEALWR